MWQCTSTAATLRTKIYIVAKDYVLPLAELNQTYAQMITSMKVTDYYTKQLKFTALFTCPLAGEHFACDGVIQLKFDGNVIKCNIVFCIFL